MKQSNPADLGGFEQRLLVELKHVVAQRSGAADTGAAARPWARMWRGVLSTGPRRLSLAAGAAAAAALVAAALTASATGAQQPTAQVPQAQAPADRPQLVPAAYTLERQADGQIKITIHPFPIDVQKLTADLKKLGFSVATFSGVSDKTTCKAGQPTMRPLLAGFAVHGKEVLLVRGQDGVAPPRAARGGAELTMLARPGKDVAVVVTGKVTSTNGPMAMTGLWLADGTPTCVSLAKLTR